MDIRILNSECGYMDINLRHVSSKQFQFLLDRIGLTYV